MQYSNPISETTPIYIVAFCPDTTAVGMSTQQSRHDLKHHAMTSCASKQSVYIYSINIRLQRCCSGTHIPTMLGGSKGLQNVPQFHHNSIKEVMQCFRLTTTHQPTIYATFCSNGATTVTGRVGKGGRRERVDWWRGRKCIISG